MNYDEIMRVLLALSCVVIVVYVVAFVTIIWALIEVTLWLVG